MRIGAPVFLDDSVLESENVATKIQQFIEKHQEKGYRSGLVPDFITLEDKEGALLFKSEMAKADLVISEVGAWCNMMHPDKAEARKKVDHMIERLRLADLVGAKTCINIIGTKHPHIWDSYSFLDWTPAFYEEAVRKTQYIIDHVNPTSTTLSFEMMPYSFLNDGPSYVTFMKDVDRTALKVHLDPCNTINSADRYFNNRSFIRETFETLSDDIVSIHLKDLLLDQKSSVMKFNEVLIGTGDMDYHEIIRQIKQLPDDIPSTLEHLSTEAEYDEAYGNFQSMLL